MGDDTQATRIHLELHATVFLVRKNRRALQGEAQILAADAHVLVGTNRDDRLVVGETTVDQFRRERHATPAQAQMVPSKLKVDRTFTGLEQTLQLKHALAWNDDLSTRRDLRRQLGFGQRQAVSIGRHTTQRLVANIEQEAVQVIPDILVRHRERGTRNQVLERRFRQTDLLNQVDIVDHRKFTCRQGREREPASTGADRNAIPVLLDLDLGPIRQCAADVEQLARRDRHFTLNKIVRRSPRDHLDFEIRTGKRDTVGRNTDQKVREHRQRLTSFNDANHLLQRLEQGFARKNETHGRAPSCFWFCLMGDLWW